MIVNPFTQGSFPGLKLKAWAHVTAAGVVIASGNVTSLTKGAVGIYTLNFTANLTTTTYATKMQSTNDTGVGFSAGARAVGSLAYTLYSSPGVPGNCDHYIEIWEA